MMLKATEGSGKPRRATENRHAFPGFSRLSLSFLCLPFLSALAHADTAAPPAVSTAPSLTIVRPAENAVLPPLSSEFIFGSVPDPAGTLTINQSTVPISSDGAYLAYLPVSSGPFTFQLTFASPAPKGGAPAPALTELRHVFVTPAPTPLPPSPLEIDPDSLSPRENEVLRAGDWLIAGMKATPGRKAFFRFGGRSWMPMAETNPALGIYRGAYLVRPGESLTPSRVEMRIGSGFWSSQKRKSPGRVAIDNSSPRIARVKSDDELLLTPAPHWGNLFPVGPGTELLVWGRHGNRDRIRVADGLLGWLPASGLKLLPEGFPPPNAVSGVITVRPDPSDNQSEVRIPLGDPVPFRAEEWPSGEGLSLFLYGAKPHTNWIIYGSTGDIVDFVVLAPENGSLRADIRLKGKTKLWGYHAEYKGAVLSVLLRAPPKALDQPGRPLSGLRVFLDPGHNPEHSGATGPLGTRESDVNWEIAQAVADEIKRQGALPILSRSTATDSISLSDRPRLAWQQNADLFVSLHNNDLPDGENPFTGSRGFSVFYFHPSSLPLARAVEASYQKLVPLPDEGARMGNYLVLRRATEMPAVLIESAYLILPEQEAKLREPSFRSLLARAVAGGLSSYCKSWRRPLPKARPAKIKIRRKSAPAPAGRRPSAAKRGRKLRPSHHVRAGKTRKARAHS